MPTQIGTTTTLFSTGTTAVTTALPPVVVAVAVAVKPFDCCVERKRTRNRGTKSRKTSNNQPEDSAGQRELAAKKMKSGAKPKKGPRRKGQ